MEVKPCFSSKHSPLQSHSRSFQATPALSIKVVFPLLVFQRIREGDRWNFMFPFVGIIIPIYQRKPRKLGQADVCSGSPCTKQISKLRKIIEQYVECRSPLYLLFIDFKKIRLDWLLFLALILSLHSSNSILVRATLMAWCSRCWVLTVHIFGKQGGILFVALPLFNPAKGGQHEKGIQNSQKPSANSWLHLPVEEKSNSKDLVYFYSDGMNPLLPKRISSPRSSGNSSLI